MANFLIKESTLSLFITNFDGIFICQLNAEANEIINLSLDFSAVPDM